MSNVGIISQARMTSSRLPGKILMQIGNKTLLKFHTDRLKLSNLPLYIATTENESDNSIIEFCKNEKIYFYRGAEDNVLSRYYECAKKFELDIIIRVTSDCPLIDGELISKAVFDYINIGDIRLYSSNCIQRTFPRGFDFEIFSFSLLEEAYKNASSVSEIEHVTPYINKNKSGKVNFRHIKNIDDKSDIRITVDTLDDFNLIRNLIEVHGAASRGYKEIIEIFDKFPDLKKFNSHIDQKYI